MNREIRQVLIDCLEEVDPGPEGWNEIIVDELVAALAVHDPPVVVSFFRPGLSTPSEIGRKGAKARAESLTPERRKEIARKAVEARWARRKAPPTGTADAAGGQ